jgi:hypothetical protein
VWACFLTKTIQNDLFGSEELLLQMGILFSFLNETSGQIRSFSSGTGHASVVFAIGRTLKGHIDNEKGTIFGVDYNSTLTSVSQIKLFIFTTFSCSLIEKQSKAGQLWD